MEYYLDNLIIIYKWKEEYYLDNLIIIYLNY